LITLCGELALEKAMDQWRERVKREGMTQPSIFHHPFVDVHYKLNDFFGGGVIREPNSGVLNC